MKFCICKGKVRVVALLDVDAFEVQIRGKAEGFTSDELATKPCAVEFNMVTSANHAAKTLGVQRGPSLDKQSWLPGCKLLSFKTPYIYGKPENLSLKKAGDDIFECLETSLEDLKENLLCNYCNQQVPEPVVEKHNCDEFYIDLTNLVHQQLWFPQVMLNIDVYILDNGSRKFKLDLPHKTVNKLGPHFVRTHWKTLEDDKQLQALLVGAEIIAQVLDAAKDKLDFDISAGLGGNKLMAKLACHRSKPNGLAVLPSTSFNRISNTMEFTKIPGLGGDTGDAIMRSYFITTIREFRDHFYDLHLWRWFRSNQNPDEIYSKCLGKDYAPVVRKSIEKITCGKSLNTYSNNRASTRDDFLIHLNYRFHEMRDNILYEYHRRKRIPKFLRLEIYEHYPNASSMRVVFRGELDFTNFTLLKFILWEKCIFETDDLVEWKPIVGDFKSMINVNSSIPLFRRDGACISSLRRINLIAYY